MQYRDHYFQTADGLRLHARDHGSEAAPGGRPVLLCLHGLTRNSADFESLAPRLARHFRVLVPEQRGRGLSEWDVDASHYQPLQYVQDMFGLLDGLGIDKVIIIGTSLGGLMAMIMAASQPQRIAGVVLNDIGPEVDPRGLARIQSYVGKSSPVSSWNEAAAQVESLNRLAFPEYDEQQWLAMARRLYREDEQGTPVLAYDPAIAVPIAQSRANAVPPDLWPLFSALASIPALGIRGATSDVLSAACFAEMQRRLPAMKAVEIPGRGHAPALDEDVALQAIDAFLEPWHASAR